MTRTNEPDLGPLSWVKGEIDQALSLATDSIRQAHASADGPAKAQFAQTHLHQVHGALSIIGLDGLTNFVAALDLFLGTLARGELPTDEASVRLAIRGLASIGNYLDELVHGAPDQPLRLLPLYRELVSARGEAPPSPADLFFPDVSVRIPRHEGAPDFNAADRLHQRRVMRLRFQRGLLDWLHRADTAGVDAMRAALAGLEISEDNPGMRALWWAGQAFVDTLDGTSPSEVHTVKHLLSRLEAQLRHAGDGPQVLPERLLRELLFCIASRPAVTPIQRAARQAWQLDTLVPEGNAVVSDLPLAPLLQELHTRLNNIKEEWNTFGEQGATALPEFTAGFEAFTKSSASVGRSVLNRLLGGMCRFIVWLSTNPQRYSEPIALEFAAALLLAESALDCGLPDSGFQTQVVDTLSRLETLARGEDISAVPSADGMASARKQQEKEALAQLSHEILSSLATVEQTLDDFFRDHSKRAPLGGLTAPLHQIEGALTMLGETEAISLIRKAGETIARLASGDSPIDDAELTELAQRFSALGFFVQSLQYSRTSVEDFLHPRSPAEPREAEIDLPALPEIPFVHAPVGPVHAVGAPRDGVETFPAFEIEAKSEPSPQPPAPAKKEEKPAALPVPPVSAEAQRLAQAPQEELDSELLSIFIEEAHEVLETVNEHIGLLGNALDNRDYLTTIRRGFHTLKGSGRMVGLSGLGEAAWGMEQTLNRWLQLEWTVTPALLQLLGDAHREFCAWVAQIENEAGYQRDVAALLAEAARLRDNDAPIQDFPAPEPEPAPTLVETPSKVPPEKADFTRTQIMPTREMFDIEDIELVELDEQPAAREENRAAPPSAEVANETVATTPIPAAPEAQAETSTSDDPSGPFTATVPVPHFEPFKFEPFDFDPAKFAAVTPTSPANEAEAPANRAEAPMGEVAASDTLLVGDVEISRALFELYVAEAQMHIATLQQELDHLEANPTLPPSDAALRAAHSCAGISGTARCAPLFHLGKALEHAQQRLYDQKQPPSANELALFKTAADALDAMLTEVVSLKMPLETPELIEQLDRIAHTPGKPGMESVTEAAIVKAAAVVFPEARQIPPPSTAAPSPTAPQPASEATQPAVADELDEQLLPIFIEEADELVNGLHTTLRAWHDDTGNASHAALVKRQLHTLKGSARMAGAMTLGSQIHQIESRLDAALNAGEDILPLIEEITSALDITGQMIGALAGGLAPVIPAAVVATTPVAPMAANTGVAAVTASVPATAVIESETAASALRVRAELVDRFVNDASEIGVARTRIEGELRNLRRSMLDLTENVIRLRNQLREIELQADVQMQTRIAQAESKHAEFDPLEMDRYTRLQELTRMMAESVNDVTTVQQNLLKNLDSADFALHSQARITRELQQALMQVRMMPFDSLAMRLYRIVRQGAKELGKRANLDIRGGGIEIDRGVLDHIIAPLEHLLRNSLAHGIEKPEVRRARGKPEIGQITLTIRQEGNEIVIELADDGAGLDFDRITERAREHGLLAPNETADTRRLTNLIFVPGFSTAEVVSAVSGRGVGMDVVKAETAAVGGRIDISTTPGSGTLFSIYLPLTLAVTQALLVRSGGHLYAIPSSMISQVMELKTDAIERLRADGGTEWLGRHYAYRYLTNLLGDRHARPEIGRYSWVLLLHSGSQTLALHVDALRGHQEIIVKNAGPQLTHIPGMSGATVLGNGEIVLIINPVAMVSREIIYGENAGTAAPPPWEETGPAHEPTVLVVDDSLTVRKITSRMLEREGYRVITAKDGVDAIESLIDDVPDIILSDIEMPRMDGFDFVRNIRANARLKDVPVIMITSRLADKHREYAMEIGANHYLGKPYQEEELLALIAGYTSRGPKTEVRRP
ncbi:MAG: Hpt domain-containing protein [Azoarcus sp.]|jgi:chemosensory pili system protein ChpA (sensor histidine kinase/response regulator)|nr:Hpt domain-containing protein [Azoarcus sp.]